MIETVLTEPIGIEDLKSARLPRGLGELAHQEFTRLRLDQAIYEYYLVA